MHILFGTVALVLLFFTLLTETFILRSATEEAAETLAGTRHITRHLFRDNQQIDRELLQQENATAASLAALEQAQGLLVTAEHNAQLALMERDTSRRLQKESKFLDEAAQSDYKRALELDAIALSLLNQAQADERKAGEAAEKIRLSSLAAFQSQIQQHILQGRNDLAVDNAHSLVQFGVNANDSSLMDSPLLRAIANHSYIRTWQTDIQLDFATGRPTQQLENSGSYLIIAQHQPSDSNTLVHFVSKDSHYRHLIPGRLDFFFPYDRQSVAITNIDDESIISILDSETPVFGRLSDRCTMAVLIDQTLYAGLSNGRVVTYSLEQLTESAPVATLPAQPTHIAVSPDRSLLAVNYDTTLQIIDIESKQPRYTFPLPSKCQQLWFLSNNSVALLTNQSYVNEFVFNQAQARRIRFRPAANDNQLVDFAEHNNSRFLLFAKGTLVKLDSQLTSTIRKLDDAIHSRILNVNQNTLQVLNRDGRLDEIDSDSLLNTGIPLSPKPAVLAATSDGKTKSVLLANGSLERYEQPAIKAGQAFAIAPELKMVGFTIGKHIVAQHGDHRVVRVLPNGDLKTLFTHSAPIRALRTLANGRFLAITDAERTTVLTVDTDGQLSTSYTLPIDVNLDTFRYSPRSESSYVCSSTKLYHFKEEQSSVFSHPLALSGLLSTSLSTEFHQLLITSSELPSRAFIVNLETLEYSAPYEFEGFISETFWNPSAKLFQLIITTRNRPDVLFYKTLHADHAQNTATIPLQIKTAKLRTDLEELILVTDNNRLNIYSLENQEIDRFRQFNRSIQDLQIVDDSRHLLVTFRDCSILLSIDSLEPATPMLEGRFLTSTQLGAQFYTIERTPSGILMSDVSSLLGRHITLEQSQSFYQQQ